MKLWRKTPSQDVDARAIPDIGTEDLEPAGEFIEAEVSDPKDGLESASDDPTIDQLAGDDAGEDAREVEFQRIKAEIHQQVIGRIDLTLLGGMNEGDLRFEVHRACEQILHERADLLNQQDRDRIIKEVIDETFGLGPLEPLLADDDISDIMINGANQVYIERKGRLELTKIRFASEAHLLKIIQKIVSAVGRRVDETSPMADARLQDGSRFNAIIPPLALDGALVSIRRFGKRALHAEDLMANSSITQDMVDFLSACVSGRLNILISGGTGSGKTTLLNILSGFIPSEERVATVEDAAELRLQQPHVIRMETRPSNIEGAGKVTTRDLVRNALRMRPDRIVVGECRGAEALDMLQAMNTGHDGSLTTVHANSPRDAISRLEMMVGMAGFDVPVWTIRKQIASAINVVVQAVRLTGGSRKITRISEITGMEGDVLTMHDIFTFKQTGVDADRRAVGYFQATGIRPTCLDRLECAGLPLPVEMFEERILKTVGKAK